MTQNESSFLTKIIKNFLSQLFIFCLFIALIVIVMSLSHDSTNEEAINNAEKAIPISSVITPYLRTYFTNNTLDKKTRLKLTELGNQIRTEKTKTAAISKSWRELYSEESTEEKKKKLSELEDKLFTWKETGKVNEVQKKMEDLLLEINKISKKSNYITAHSINVWYELAWLNFVYADISCTTNQTKLSCNFEYIKNAERHLSHIKNKMFDTHHKDWSKNPNLEKNIALLDIQIKTVKYKHNLISKQQAFEDLYNSIFKETIERTGIHEDPYFKEIYPMYVEELAKKY